MRATADACDDRESFETALRTALDALRIPVDAAQRALMYRHYRLVIEANRQFNLTRITSPQDAAVKHDADSLTVLAARLLDPAVPLRVLDVGTGAGFPAVPLAIACPPWHITAIDGTGKKARFVAQCARELGLANLQARHIRAEDLAREQPGAFDAVLLRAVSELAAGIESTAVLVRPGGMIVFYKTARIPDAEEQKARQAAAKSRLKPLDPVSFDLPTDQGVLERRFYCYRR